VILLVKLRDDINFIMIRLIIPIIIAIIILILINYFYFYNDLFTNLIADLFVILISVFFVSWVLNENEKRIWKETDDKVKSRIQFFINLYIANIRDWLNYSWDSVAEISTINDPDLCDFKVVEKKLLKFTEEIMLRDFDGRSKGELNWKLLFEGIGEDDGLKEVEKLIDKFLVRYNDKISPELFSKILDFDDYIYKTIREYKTFNAIFIEPDYSNKHQNQFRNSVSKELKNSLKTAISIHYIINDKPKN
jgi:hypothetical protein